MTELNDKNDVYIIASLLPTMRYVILLPMQVNPSQFISRLLKFL